MVITVAFGVNVSTARADYAPHNRIPVVVLRSPYFGNLDEGTNVSATIQGMSISCYTVSNNRLRCVVPDNFKDQYVTIKVHVEDVYLNFYVYVPDVTKYLIG